MIRFLPIDSREKAYIYAVSSAGLAYSVTKACSQSLLANCSCDNGITGKIRGKWNWGGCSDDIQYGSMFSRLFLDSQEDNATAGGLMNLHNNEAGRRVSIRAVCFFSLSLHILSNKHSEREQYLEETSPGKIWKIISSSQLTFLATLGVE